MCVRTKAMRGASLTTCFDILHRSANAQEKETPVLPTVCVCGAQLILKPGLDLGSVLERTIFRMGVGVWPSSTERSQPG